MIAAMKGSPCGSCTQNPLTDSVPTSSCWAIATRPKASTPSTMWRRTMEGYQYGDDQDDDGVPDVQSYHNLTLNKKGVSSSISPSLLAITARCTCRAASKVTGAPANPTSGISSATRAGERGQLRLIGRGTRPSALMEPTGSPRSTSPSRSACSPVTATVAITRSTGPMPRPLPAVTATVIPAGRPGSAERC